MTTGPAADAALAAVLFAVDPPGLGGVCLRAGPSPARDAFLAIVKGCVQPVRRMPLNIADGRLLGGLDIAATLRAGRPIAERGLLAEADGGVILVAMAERLTASVAGQLCATIDTGAVVTARDGVAARHSARLGFVALDEGIAEDERVSAALADRLAFHVDLSCGLDDDDLSYDSDAVAAAQGRLASVTAGDDIVAALCSTALALGIDSLRAPTLALRAALASAALAGRPAATLEDAALAARLVLAPRATRLPAQPDAPAEEAPPETPPETSSGPDEVPADEQTAADQPPLDDVVLEAAAAAIPAGLLAQLLVADPRAGRPRATGKMGTLQSSGTRGRPGGVRRAAPSPQARLNLVETLRAAAPWQRLRQAETGQSRLQVRIEDFHVTRFRPRGETTTIFAVDASGSAAAARLAEAKGAVELLLADCYVRRDSVAVLAFRGRSAELLLPPTRSLVRAKRSLAALPGGGGTPLAAGLDAAAALAASVRRRGGTPVIVLLTDGRANVGRDGVGGRARAEPEALAAAGQLRAEGHLVLLIDTAARPTPQARALATAMAARYLPLPYADAAALSRAVQAASAAR